MSFREKFNWVVAGVTALVLAGLGVWYVKAVGSGAALDSAGPVIAAYIVWFLVMVVGAVIIASRAPDEAEEPSDERDRMINMKAALPTMHIYGFALTGLILLMFVDPGFGDQSFTESQAKEHGGGINFSARGVGHL